MGGLTNRSRRGAEARRVFERFRDLPGSRAIASEFALRGLIAELERSAPATILELGPGIGTTTKVLLDLNPAGAASEVWCVEQDAWCRGQLDENLADDAARLHIVESVLDLPPEAGPFQFVLVDGPGDVEWADRLAHRASVFVENDRSDQRAAMSARTTRVHVSRSRWPLASLGRLAGYHVIQFEPTAGERVAFAIGHRFNLIVDRLRMLNRRLLTRIGLRSVLDWDERRVYRDRLPPVPEDVERNRARREQR